jgi:hypothetical protein
MRTPLILLGSVVAATLAGCSCGSDTDPSTTGGSSSQGTGGSGGGVACIAGLESITLSPADSRVSLD